MMNKKYFHAGFTGAVCLAVTCVINSASAQLTGVKRTDLQRHDLSVPGREMVQALIEFGDAAEAARHSHPGEEIIYVVKGLLEYQVEGEAPRTLKAGEVLFVPAGKVHSAKNVGSGEAAELATYIVEKGKPLIVLSK